MKSLKWHLFVVTALAGLSLFGRATPAFAQDNRGGDGDRLARLERRVNEIAEQQNQFMRQIGTQMEQVGKQMEHLAAMRQPGAEQGRPPMPPPGAPAAGPQHPHAAKLVKGLADTLGLLFLIGFICNILMAIWIFTDIRKRGEGSAIFIAMALVAGIPAALIYALTRIGDKKA